MFGTSGIRGPVGDEVTAGLALRVGRALGAETDRAVVGLLDEDRLVAAEIAVAIRTLHAGATAATSEPFRPHAGSSRSTAKPPSRSSSSR